MISRLKFEINELVKEMLDRLPVDVWVSDNTTFLDPSMGGGQFIIEICNRLTKAGHSWDNIRSRVWGLADTPLSLNYVTNKYNNKIHGQFCVGGIETLEKWTGENMKFDVVVGNPPFNDGATSRKDGTNRRQGGRILAKDFINMSLLISTGFVSMIASPSKLWSGASKQRNLDAWQSAGLYEVTNVSKDFHTVDSSLNIACFFFDRNTTVSEINDEWDTIKPVASSLAHRWRGASGTDRKTIQSYITNTPGGQYRVFETAVAILETNDKASFDLIKEHDWDSSYRVVFSKIRTDKIGRVTIANPGDKTSSSASCIICDNYDHAVRMKDYLESPDVVSLSMDIKDITSDYNSKFLFDRIPDIS